MNTVAVRHLGQGERPPSNAKSVIVARDNTARFIEEGYIVAHSEGVAFYVPFHSSQAQRDGVLAEALQWASDHGFAEVFVRD